MPVKSFQDDVLLKLQDAEFAATYLKVALDETLQDGNTEAFLLALKNVVDARSKVSAVAKQADVNRQHLYKLLSGEGNPTLDTMISILGAVGLSMNFTPALDEVS
ncbi:MAG: helix-turn-helix domain-containing protein [Acaryochloridaceae cyanobacterium RL_2_7]|nr:helix-turn-helix domain-containing protein [Acaryochloridaceae cyanobacterium RL_2_7]